MDHFNLIFLCGSLYLVNYIFQYFVIKSTPRCNFDLIVFLTLLVTSKMDIIHTEYTVLKLTLVLILTLQIVFKMIDKNLKREQVLFINLIGTAAAISFFALKLQLPLVLLNGLLIVVSASLMIIELQFFRLSQEKIKKNTVEVSFIGFFAALALGLGSSPFNLFMGLVVLALYKISELYHFRQEYDHQQFMLTTRLNDLELRFDRTVEFEAKKRTAIMADKVEYIREKSQKDPLSKAYNRHGITSEINSLINDSSVKIFSIALFDIDFFKAINDTKGHVIGDECIKFLSYVFMANNRKTDILGRYGGDEFILLMPHVNAPAAIEICDRLRKEVAQKSSPKFSISMGIATFPYDGRTFTELLESADKSLYHAKENGKNKVSYIGNVPILKK